MRWCSASLFLILAFRLKALQRRALAPGGRSERDMKPRTGAPRRRRQPIGHRQPGRHDIDEADQGEDKIDESLRETQGLQIEVLIPVRSFSRDECRGGQKQRSHVRAQASSRRTTFMPRAA